MRGVTADGNDGVRSEVLIVAPQQMCAAARLPPRLRQVKIKSDDIGRLAGDVMQQTRLLANNPRRLAHHDACAIDHSAR